MDRTTELFSIIEVLKQTGTVTPSPYAQLYALRNPPSSSTSSSSSSSSPSNLLRQSRSVGKRIRSTQRSVLRLVHLVQRKGLFDDPAIEINELTVRIKSDLQTIDQSLQLFTNHITSLFTFSSSSSLLTSTLINSNDKHTNDTSTSSIPQYQQILQTILDTLRGHVLVLTRMFQEALRIRSENMKDQAHRRKEYASSRWTPTIATSSGTLQSPLFSTNTLTPPPPPPPPSATTSNHHHHPNPTGATNTPFPSSFPPPSIPSTVPSTGLRKRGGVGINPHSSIPSHTVPSLPTHPINPPPMNPYSQQLTTLHDARTRMNDIKSIESTIVELGSMFTHMATVVAEQGDTINRIDTDMDIISSNVEKGKHELTQFYTRVANQRTFILKLFALLIFIILLFAVFRQPSDSSSSVWPPSKSSSDT